MIDSQYFDALMETIGKEYEVIIDRPLGSTHPEYRDMIYPINYGYIKELKAPDGEYQDVYLLGINKSVLSFKGIVIAVIKRSDDIECKLVICPKGLDYTDEEIEENIQFQEKYFKHRILRN